MKIIIDDTKRFKAAFEAISTLINEGRIEIDDDGLKLEALDKSHITFVNLELNPEFFQEFDLDYPLQLNVDIEEFNKVLKRAKAEDTIILEVTDEQLILTFNGRAKRIFELNLIDMEYEPPSPPVIEYPVTIEVPTDLFKDGLTDAKLITEKVSLEADSDKFYIKGEGIPGKNQFEYLHGEQVTGSYGSIYNLDNLQKMLKADKFASIIQLSIGKDVPCKLLMTNATEDGSIQYLLAPRIESED